MLSNLSLSECTYAVGICKQLTLRESKDVRFEKPKEVDKCTVTTCYTGDNGILKNPGNQTELVNGSKLLRVCDDSASGNYSCCNAAGTCLEQFLKVEGIYVSS
uniref:Uncharacterized protein n=1 Tax=Magallana gigas TaxID=29159 RepID=K1Q6F0_MAGGI